MATEGYTMSPEPYTGTTRRTHEVNWLCKEGNTTSWRPRVAIVQTSCVAKTSHEGYTKMWILRKQDAGGHA